MSKLVPLNTALQSVLAGIGTITKPESLEDLRPIYLERYGAGTLTDTDINVIHANETELEICRNCAGECPKKSFSYVRPVMEIHNGILYTSYAECQYGLQRRMKAKCRFASLPEKYADKTFKDYDVTEDNRTAVKMARWYVAKMPPRSLYFYGECGTGKTFLATLIAQEFLHNFKTVIFGDVPELLEEIKRTFDKENASAADVVARYCECDLLILDDMGTGKITDWALTQLYRIINARYSTNKPMIVTSNFDLEGLNKRLASADSFSAKRIVSRLSEICEEAYFGTNDRRQQS